MNVYNDAFYEYVTMLIYRLTTFTFMSMWCCFTNNVQYLICYIIIQFMCHIVNTVVVCLLYRMEKETSCFVCLRIT